MNPFSTRLLCLLAMLPLAGCAVYHPQPLSSPEVEASLDAPDKLELARAATQYQHPLLPPVELDLKQPLTGDEIAVIAVIANPDLRALRTQQGVADAQVFASGLLPDPHIDAGFDKILSPTGAGLISGRSAALSLDILGALATRRADLQIERATAAQARRDIAWEEWSTAGQARLLARRLTYRSEASILSRTAADAAETALAQALSAAQRGDLKGDELQTRRIAAADARDRALAAERDAGTTRLELNQLLGFPPSETLSLAPMPALAAWHHVEADQLFKSARARRLDLAALEQGYAAQEARLRRAVLGQYPRLGITVTRARDTSDVQTLGPAVTLDLPLWNRNRGAIAVASADRRRLSAEFVARLHQTRAEIAALSAALDRDEPARAVLAAQVPEVIRTADEIEAAAGRHDLTQATADAARSAAIDKQLALLALEQSCAEQRIALALATGSPLADSLEVP